MRVSGCCIALCDFLMKVRKGAAVLFLHGGVFAAAGRKAVCRWKNVYFRRGCSVEEAFVFLSAVFMTSGM